MKRGWLILVLIILSISLVSSQADLGGCVGVKLCDTEFPCGISGDSVCPEDFINNPGAASCSSLNGKCLDADCKACIEGTVINASGDPVGGADITLELYAYDEFGEVINIRETTTSSSIDSIKGIFNFNFEGLPTASSGHNAIITAHHPKFGYDVVYRDQLHSEFSHGCYQIDFEFPEAYCEADCTLIGTDICFDGCYGEGECLINSSESLGYTEEAKTYCTDNLAKAGDRFEIGREGDSLRWVDCCNDNGKGSYLEYTPKAEPSDLTITKIKDAIKVTRILRYNNKIAKAHVYYWE